MELDDPGTPRPSPGHYCLIRKACKRSTRQNGPFEYLRFFDAGCFPFCPPRAMFLDDGLTVVPLRMPAVEPMEDLLLTASTTLLVDATTSLFSGGRRESKKLASYHPASRVEGQSLVAVEIRRRLF